MDADALFSLRIVCFTKIKSTFLFMISTKVTLKALDLIIAAKVIYVASIHTNCFVICFSRAKAFHLLQT